MFVVLEVTPDPPGFDMRSQWGSGGRGRDRTYDQSIKSRKMWVLQWVAAPCI